MKKKFHLLVNILFVFFFFRSNAQTEEKINFLFERKWKIKSIEVAGQNISPSNINKDDYTQYFIDHTVKNFISGNTAVRQWKYDDTLNTLTIYSDKDNTSTILKILKLNQTEFIFESTAYNNDNKFDYDGVKTIIHMNSVK
jgi:hypothetical protein